MSEEQQQGQFEPASAYDLPVYGWLRKFTIIALLIFVCAFFILDDGRGWALLTAFFLGVIYLILHGLDTQRRAILTQQQQIDRLFQLLEEKNTRASEAKPVFSHSDTEYRDASKDVASPITSPFDDVVTPSHSTTLNTPQSAHVAKVDPYTDALLEVENARKSQSVVESKPEEETQSETSTVQHAAVQHTPDWMTSGQPRPVSTPDPLLSSHQQDETASNQDVYSMTSLWRAFMTWFKGGNSIVRIAIIILLIGVILLLRFASEYWQPTLSTKMAGIAVAGTALTAVGYWLRNKRYGYAISVQGAGLGILFLVLFSAFRLEVISSVMLSYGLLIGLLVTTLLLALRQNALILAFIALGSGFIAPFILNTGSNNIPALFSYYLALNVALAVIAFFKPWRILNTVSLLSTFGIGGLSIWLKATPEQYGMLTLLVWLHFALYLFISIRYSLQAMQYKMAFKDIPIIDTTLIFATPFMAFTLYAGLVYHNSQSLSIASAVLAVVYFATGFVLHKKYQFLSLLIQCFYGLGLTFFALILPFAFDAQWTSTGWAVQALALIWLGSRHRLKNSVIFGLILLACSTVSWGKSIIVDESTALLAVLFLAGALLGSLYVFFTPEQNQSEQLENTPASLALLSLSNMLNDLGRAFSFVALQGVLLIYCFITYQLDQQYLNAWLMLIMSIFCVGLSVQIYRLHQSVTRRLQLFIACALIYFALIPIFLWDSEIISLWWSVQGLLTVLASSRYALPYIRHLGAGTLLASVGATFLSITDPQPLTLTVVLVLMLSLVTSAYHLFYSKSQAAASLLDRVWSYALFFFSFLFTLYVGEKLSTAVGWTFYSFSFMACVWWLILSGVYRALQKTFAKEWLWLTLVVMMVGVLDVLYLVTNNQDIWQFDFDLKAQVLIVAMIWLMAYVFILKSYTSQLHKVLADVLMVIAVGMLAVMGAVFSQSELAFVPCLMLLPVVVLLASLKVPFLAFLPVHWKNNQLLLIVALISLWAVSIVHDGTWNLTYIPILNPIDLLSVGIFVIIVLNIQSILSSVSKLDQAQPYQIVLAVVLLLTGLLLISSLMLRSLHHYMVLPYWSLEAWQNGTVQASLTILWAILALILTTFASKKALRYVWLLGISVLAVVIAKLIFLDLSHTHTITRIISFIGSGLIMLVIGYFAPLPPSSSKPSEPS